MTIIRVFLKISDLVDMSDLLIEFFYNSLFSAKSWQNPARIDEEEQYQNCNNWGLNSQPPDHHSKALPTELSHYFFWLPP